MIFLKQINPTFRSYTFRAVEDQRFQLPSPLVIGANKLSYFLSIYITYIRFGWVEDITNGTEYKILIKENTQIHRHSKMVCFFGFFV